MDKQRYEQIQALFLQAAERPPQEQLAYLKARCQDESIVADVLKMLAADSDAASILERSVPELAHELLDDDSSLPRHEFGPYRIQRLLGQGGMGSVYLAERDDLGGQAAIKVLRDGPLSPARRERFASEQRTLAQLSHPSIARIYDADTLPDGTPWFAMEFVDGQPITVFCRNKKATLRERLRLFRAVCEAVVYAHQHAIIHRDLKPSNILVTPEGSVKLLDFGTAKRLRSDGSENDRTQTELRLMTPAYAAPEQVRGDRPTTQIDVYSLGVILYELLTGKRPFDLSGRTPEEVEWMIQHQEPTAPSVALKRGSGIQNGTTVPIDRTAPWRELDIICLAAMHKELSRRYPSVEALLRDIDHCLQGEPLEVLPEPWSRKMVKFIKRNQRTLAVAGGALAVVLLVVVIFTARLARLRRAEQVETMRKERIEAFMLNLFEGGDTEAGPARGMQVVTLLDRGVKQAQSLRNEPVIQADLNAALGNTYRKMGHLDQADSLLTLSLEQWKSISGADSHEAAQALIMLGLLRLDQARLDEAERLVREGLAMQRRNLPASHPSIGRALFALGRVVEERGRYEEAIKILDEAIGLQSASRQVTTDLSDSINALVIAHQSIGHFELAETLNQRALEMDRQLYGELHPRVAEDMANLGEIEAEFHRWTKAEQYYRKALAIEESWRGREHGDTATCMLGISQVLRNQNRLDEAAAMMRDALAIQERVYGKSHPQVASALNFLGSLEVERGHYNEAEAALMRMLEIDRAVYGENHKLVAIAYESLGELYLNKKNYRKAERYFADSIRLLTATQAPGNSTLGLALARLGATLIRLKRYLAAEEKLLAAYQILSQQPGQSSNAQYICQDLIDLYSALHRPDQADKFRALLASLRQADSSPPATR